MIQRAEASSELELLRAAALHAATRSSQPQAEYERLRELASSLNRRYDLSSDEDFAQQFPSPFDLEQIRRLEAAFGSVFNCSAADPVDPEGLLYRLMGWAAGMCAACQTLRD